MPGNLASMMVVLESLVASGFIIREPNEFGDPLKQYCNTDQDWGPIPARPPSASTLLQAQVFIRHGARTLSTATESGCFPEKWDGKEEGTWTCDLNFLENSVSGAASDGMTPSFRVEYTNGRNVLPGNCMIGQLVDSGFKMERRNGERLREAYIERERLVKGALRADDQRQLLLRSTDVPRTKQSGMALVSGLFPDARHTTVVMKTMDVTLENMVPNRVLCPGLNRKEQEFWRSDFPAKPMLLEVCKKIFGWGNFSVTDCFNYVRYQTDCLMTRLCPDQPFYPKSNKTIPPRYTADGGRSFQEVWQVQDDMMWDYYKMVGYLIAGKIVPDILELADPAAAGRPTTAGGSPVPALAVFSGHDETLWPMWAAFDLRPQPPHTPAFGSMLVLEVWNSTSGPFVRWVSNGAVVEGTEKSYADFRAGAQLLRPSSEDCAA